MYLLLVMLECCDLGPVNTHYGTELRSIEILLNVCHVSHDVSLYFFQLLFKTNSFISLLVMLCLDQFLFSRYTVRLL